MEDFDMEEDFDFGSLTLGESPRSSISPSTEVLDLSDSLSATTLSDQSSAVQAQQAQAQTSNTNPTTALTTATTTISGEGERGGEEGATPDNGPWAKLPSSGAGDINPYLPGVTAQKLDAMAMDPHHVFKSAPPHSGDLPFSIPPPSSSSSSSSREQQQKDKDKNRIQDEKTDDGKKDKIPDWMLADPEFKPTTDFDWITTTMTTSQKDDSLGWGDPGTFGGFGYSGADLSTTVDSNALFGFSSYPTYETLSFANAIAEEQHRKHTILASGGAYDPFSSSSSSSGGGEQTRTTREGGFARFGNTVRGDGQIAPVFGRRPSSSLTSGSSGSGTDVGSSNDHGFTWDKQDQRKSLTAGSEQRHKPQWQTWRTSGSTPQGVPDLDQLMDEDLEEDDPFEEPQIK
ncbi:hypothetical protein BG015_011308 [Linnemannia schmuckeri]|uniref:Uncharacterized protein n=1 Tax=Linnemannia schmuckeri TaxID=64567 RepID=A0A9P5V8H5_9FUNG|nr:hypothetical protein BG015_011308 [Linnemannia schmuckeri]